MGKKATPLTLSELRRAKSAAETGDETMLQIARRFKIGPDRLRKELVAAFGEVWWNLHKRGGTPAAALGLRTLRDARLPDDIVPTHQQNKRQRARRAAVRAAVDFEQGPKERAAAVKALQEASTPQED